MDVSFGWASMIGGLAFFFFGLTSARQGLQLAAGERLRALMGRLTQNRLFALGLGASITVMLQSSSATTVLLVSFVETQLLTLVQAIGVILGAGVGTTLVVVLLSFQKITSYALYLVAGGMLLSHLGRSQKMRYIGSIVLGFGMIFFGMYLMSAAAVPLRESPAAMQAFTFLAKNPLANLIFATVFTGIVQASAATIGLAIALSFSGTITFEAALPIVLGANIGTCITAGLACFGVGVEGRRVAVAHVLMKIVGAMIVFPFLGEIAQFIMQFNAHLSTDMTWMHLSTSGEIALSHLLFNLFLVVLFLPFTNVVVWMVKKIVPQQAHRKEAFRPKYLEDAALPTPALAFAQVRREVMRIAQIAHEMFAHVLDLFKDEEEIDRLAEKTASADDKIDLLEKAVRFYLAKISQKMLNESQSIQQVSLLMIAGELEDIGDVISKEVILLAHKKRKKWTRFSDEGWVEIKHLHELVLQNFDLTISMLTHPHEDIALKVIRHDHHLNEVELELRQSHLMRLHDKMRESFDTSSIHLDLMSQFRTINAKLVRIVEIARELS